MTRAVVGIFRVALSLAFIVYGIRWSAAGRPDSGLVAVGLALFLLLGAVTTTLHSGGIGARGER